MIKRTAKRTDFPLSVLAPIKQASVGESFFGTHDFTLVLNELSLPEVPRMSDYKTDGARFLYLEDRLSFGDYGRILFVVQCWPKYIVAFEEPWTDKLVRWQIVDLEFDSEAWQYWDLAWWIIDNPDLMEKKPRDVRSKAEIRQRNKRQLDRPRTVTIVDLRAPHRKSRADVAEAERTYRHRWIVRGHWHRFWTGPRNGERKLETRYVMEYVKGPAGAPLNVTTKVSKW